MAAGIHEPDGKRIGTSTIGAGFGGVVGFQVGEAVADIVVHAFPNTGPVEESIAYLLNIAIFVVGIILGGKFTPSNQVKTVFSSTPVQPYGVEDQPEELLSYGDPVVDEGAEESAEDDLADEEDEASPRHRLEVELHGSSAVQR